MQTIRSATTTTISNAQEEQMMKKTAIQLKLDPNNPEGKFEAARRRKDG